MWFTHVPGKMADSSPAPATKSAFFTSLLDTSSEFPAYHKSLKTYAQRCWLLPFGQKVMGPGFMWQRAGERGEELVERAV